MRRCTSAVHEKGAISARVGSDCRTLLMDQSSFDMVLSDDLGRGGVGLNEAVSRLLALSELYSAVISSKTSPGNQRVRLPVWAEAIQPTVSEASPTQSLKVAIELPSDLDDDDYEKSELPRGCNRDFIDTVGAVVDEDDSKIVQLYPEKADRLRILQKISDLSRGAGWEASSNLQAWRAIDNSSWP